MRYEEAVTESGEPVVALFSIISAIFPLIVLRYAMFCSSTLTLLLHSEVLENISKNGVSTWVAIRLQENVLASVVSKVHNVKSCVMATDADGVKVLRVFVKHYLTTYLKLL